MSISSCHRCQICGHTTDNRITLPGGPLYICLRCARTETAERKRERERVRRFEETVVKILVPL